ncbi:unnamed protein product [Onchocerca ochengi]|uniref:RING-type domain-containing protein n=1 Tax=Onchocerca ochengi TaxID=42157 RepID=A0A182EJ83_ONCOC|nr:unnamed protein product [Onchocerca ochengi]
MFNKLSFDPPIRSLALPIGRLNYMPMDQIVNGDICRLVTTNATTKPKLVYSSTSYQKIITICGNCTECPVGLISIYAYLKRLLKDIEISLIVIIRGINHRQLDDGDNEKKIYFTFIGKETPIALDDCQIIDAAEADALRSFSKTSVLFVSISFIILMVISLAWLTFYYIQRFRYAHAKDRLQRRLFNAAKKALARIPTRPLRIGDKELDTDCPVCIDPYRTGDIIRSLPCRHIFHKTCVDPWLLEHRTCPMCKSDILKAFGFYVSSSKHTSNNANREDVHQQSRDGDILSDDIHSLTGSESTFRYTGHIDGRNSSSVSNFPQQQLVQVLHCSNINAFSITPLTIHCNSPQKNVNTNSEQENNETNRVSWQFRKSKSTTSHAVNVSHFRSRSLSHDMSSLESEKPKARISLGTGLTTLHFPPLSIKNITCRDNASPILMASSDPTSPSFTVSSNQKNCCLQQKLKPKRISSQDTKRPQAESNYLASVESL